MRVKICLVAGRTAGILQPTDFFVEALDRHGVEVQRIDSDGHRPVALGMALNDLVLRGKVDRVVIWNADALALELRAFAAIGQMVVVPAPILGPTRPVEWWQQFQTEQIMSFDRAQHTILRAAGLDSAYFHYSPPPVPGTHQVDVTARRSAVLWEEHGSTHSSITRAAAQCRAMGLVHLAVARLHGSQGGERLAALRQELGDLVALPDGRSAADLGLLGQLVAEHPCLIAPGPSHALCPISMRAIALGRLLVASRDGPMSDHIGHGSSGLLYAEDEPLDLPWLGAGALHDLMAAARLRAERAALRWQADCERLVSLIAADGQRWSGCDRSAAFGTQLRRNANARSMHAAGLRREGGTAEEATLVLDGEPVGSPSQKRD